MTSSSQAKPLRISSLDLLKLLGILLVMMGHCLRKFLGNAFLATPLNDFLWLSEMPLFFLVAGYVHTKEEKLNRWYLLLWGILKKALWYLWPIITFALIRVYCFGQYEDFPHYYDHFLNNPSEGLWFFFVLYWMVVFFDVGTYIGHFFHNPMIKGLLPVLTSVLVDAVLLLAFNYGGTDGIYLGTGLFRQYSVYYLVGYGLFLAYRNADALRPRFPKAEIGVGVGCLAVFLLIALACPGAFYWDTSLDSMRALRFCAGLSSSLFLFLLCRYLCRFRFFRILSFGGRYSGAAYWAQPNLILWWSLWKADNVAMQYLSGFALEGLVILFLAGCAFLTYWIPFAYFAFFFKPQSHYSFEKRWLFFFG